MQRGKKTGNCECIRPPDAATVLVRFNYDAHAKCEVAQPIRCRLVAFLLLIRYIYAVTLTFDL